MPNGAGNNVEFTCFKGGAEEEAIVAASLFLCGPALDSVLVASSSCFEGGDGGAEASVPTLTRLLLTITL